MKEQTRTLYRMVWDRPTESRDLLELTKETLEKTECDYMIVGHTPHETVKYLADGSLILLDTAWSRWMLTYSPSVAEVTQTSPEVKPCVEITVVPESAMKPEKKNRSY